MLEATIGKQLIEGLQLIVYKFAMVHWVDQNDPVAVFADEMPLEVNNENEK